MVLHLEGLEYVYLDLRSCQVEPLGHIIYNLEKQKNFNVHALSFAEIIRKTFVKLFRIRFKLAQKGHAYSFLFS